MRQMVAGLNASDLDIRYETLLGEPFLEIIHGVQQEHYDLVLCGTRGLAAWQRLFVGSTASRLIRKCPSSVWIVKEQHVSPPATILAATDFSDASCRAVKEALQIAEIAAATLHLVHVVDLSDLPEELTGNLLDRQSLLAAMDEEGARRLEGLVAAIPAKSVRIERHLTRGVPWKEVERLAKEFKVDLIALGTVGRSGIEGVLLGNTAEKVLHTCDCSILTAKPADFVSPIVPTSWPAHPGAAS
jgi:nucleotide-binding universal stress UspA family protein